MWSIIKMQRLWYFFFSAGIPATMFVVPMLRPKAKLFENKEDHIAQLKWKNLYVCCYWQITLNSQHTLIEETEYQFIKSCRFSGRRLIWFVFSIAPTSTLWICATLSSPAIILQATNHRGSWHKTARLNWAHLCGSHVVALGSLPDGFLHILLLPLHICANKATRSERTHDAQNHIYTERSRKPQQRYG